jgi:hypothetical protein
MKNIFNQRRLKKMRTTDVEYKKMALDERIKKLSGSVKNEKCGGVLRKIRRMRRNLEK